jgi:putative transposase
LNAHLERLHRFIKEECLSKIIFFGERSLRRAVDQYLLHYHAEKNHQGLENALIQTTDAVGCVAGTVHCRRRLGGYCGITYREAA